MAETPDLMTLDGRAPNAGVPPGRMLVKRPKPPSEPPAKEQPVKEQAVIIVPFVQQRDIQEDSAAVLPIVIHRPSNIQDRSLITPVCTRPLTQTWSSPTPQEISTKVENHTHYHKHIHNHQTTGPVNDNSHDFVQSSAPTAQTHTWIRCVPSDPSPARYHPEPCPRLIQIQRLPRTCIPKNTTMRDFLLAVLPAFGISCERGNGVQQVFPRENNVWGPGQIFKWGVGEAETELGETELGKGYPAHEMYIARWTGR